MLTKLYNVTQQKQMEAELQTQKEALARSASTSSLHCFSSYLGSCSCQASTQLLQSLSSYVGSCSCQGSTHMLQSLSNHLGSHSYQTSSHLLQCLSTHMGSCSIHAAARMSMTKAVHLVSQHRVHASKADLHMPHGASTCTHHKAKNRTCARSAPNRTHGPYQQGVVNSCKSISVATKCATCLCVKHAYLLQAAATTGGAEAAAGALQCYHPGGEGQPAAAEHIPHRASGGCGD